MKATLALALLPLIAASPTPNSREAPKPKPAPGLGDLAKKAGLKYFGTAIDNVVLNNTKYTNIAFNRSEFNQVTPSNGQKWVHIEPQRNVFNYTLGDQVVDPSKEAGQMRRCHTFLWHSQLPDWLNNGNWTKTELLSILETHIKNEADYYWGDCYAWDVVVSSSLYKYICYQLKSSPSRAFHSPCAMIAEPIPSFLLRIHTNMSLVCSSYHMPASAFSTHLFPFTHSH
jgi:endo-1,4-beta-xylanase